MDNSMSPAAWRESFVSSSKAQNIRNEQDVAMFVRLFGFLPALSQMYGTASDIYYTVGACTKVPTHIVIEPTEVLQFDNV